MLEIIKEWLKAKFHVHNWETIELRKVDVYSSSTSTRPIYTKYMYIQRWKYVTRFVCLRLSFNMEVFWITGRGAILKVSDRNKEYKVGESVEIKNRLYEITGIEGMMLLTEPPKKVTVGLRLKMTKEEYNQIIPKL